MDDGNFCFFIFFESAFILLVIILNIVFGNKTSRRDEQDQGDQKGKNARKTVEPGGPDGDDADDHGPDREA